MFEKWTLFRKQRVVCCFKLFCSLTNKGFGRITRPLRKGCIFCDNCEHFLKNYSTLLKHTSFKQITNTM